MLRFNMLASGQIGSGIGGLDWGIILVFLAFTTVVAVVTRGRQAGIRDFFLGDRNLPWTVVCLSLIATEISAASFVGVPYGTFSGSLVYLQLAIGTILARVIVGYLFLPAFYESEIYSPYQYVGRKLGLGAERTTRSLFAVGAVFGQAVRVLIVAEVLLLITGVSVMTSILVIIAFAVLWAIVGGIRTVVWTDVVQLFVLVAAVLAAVIYLIIQTDGGFAEIMRKAAEAQKLRVLDFRLNQALALTIWTGILGSTFNTMASHGADQMNTQRLLCCRTVQDARKAVIWSSASQIVVVLLLFVGLGLFCYYGQNVQDFLNFTYGAGGEKAAFPIFIATVMPTGLKGLLVIGLLAAAISSLSSALAALSQTTSRSLCAGADAAGATDGKARVTTARLFVLGWGVVLGLTACYFHEIVLDAVVGTALKTTSFTYGALLGALLLAFLPHPRDGRGLLFAVPTAVLAALGLSLHSDLAHWIIIVGVLAILAAWFYVLFYEAEKLLGIEKHEQFVQRAWYVLLAEFPRTIWLLAGVGLVWYLHFGTFSLSGSATGSIREIAWPWYLPMGTGITVTLGYLLSRPSAHAKLS